jgi:cytochrome b subunit of formate dehydrogenase
LNQVFTNRVVSSILVYAVVSGFGLSWLILQVVVPMLTTPFSLGSLANFPFGLDFAYLINLFFQLLITGLILFAISHNSLDLITKAARGVVRVREGPSVERFDLNQRVQHLWIIVTMTVLALTGFAQMNYESWGRLVILPMGGLQVSMEVHLVAAFFLGLVIVYHFVFYSAKYIVSRAKGEHLSLPIMIGLGDVKNLLQNVKYMLLGRGGEPQYGKYDYAQKFDYWGIYWGTTILVAPGVLLWAFGSTFLGGLPFIFHTDEAMLAVLFLLVFHFYQTHFNPQAFPVNTVFLTGKTVMGELQEDHPSGLRGGARGGRKD